MAASAAQERPPKLGEQSEGTTENQIGITIMTIVEETTHAGGRQDLARAARKYCAEVTTIEADPNGVSSEATLQASFTLPESSDGHYIGSLDVCRQEQTGAAWGVAADFRCNWEISAADTRNVIAYLELAARMADELNGVHGHRQEVSPLEVQASSDTYRAAVPAMTDETTLRDLMELADSEGLDPCAFILAAGSRSGA